MKRLYLLRHCEAKRHPVLGYTLDELTDKGIGDAGLLAKNFNNPIVHIISSPHLRTLRTAEIIAREKKLDVTIDLNWGEISRGIYNCRPYKEFLNEWAKKDNDYEYVPPNGESVSQGRKRIINGVEDLLTLEGDVLCVTHAGLISNLLMMLYSLDFETGKPGTGGLCELSFDGNNFILAPDLNKYLNTDKIMLSPKTKLEQFK